MSEIPEFTKFRFYVDHIPNRRNRVLIKTLYLTASRTSELCNKIPPSELAKKKTKPYGRFLTWKLQDYKLPNSEETEKALLLTIAVAKRKMKRKRGDKTVKKIIALPTSPKYEPWTLELLKYLKEKQTLSFNLTPRSIRAIVKKELEHLDPEIHPHSLRHYRITHLVEVYDFDPYDITAYAGWTFRTGFGQLGFTTGKLDTYLHLAWKRYFPKLLKPIFQKEP